MLTICGKPSHGANVIAWGLKFGLFPGQSKAIYYAHDVYRGDGKGGKFYTGSNAIFGAGRMSCVWRWEYDLSDTESWARSVIAGHDNRARVPHYLEAGVSVIIEEGAKDPVKLAALFRTKDATSRDFVWDAESGVQIDNGVLLFRSSVDLNHVRLYVGDTNLEAFVQALCQGYAFRMETPVTQNRKGDPISVPLAAIFCLGQDKAELEAVKAKRGWETRDARIVEATAPSLYLGV